MKSHFNSIAFNYGDVGIRMPNTIFRDLSNNIKNKNGSTNIQQVAFSYTYLVSVAFLYNNAKFVDIDNETYVQNSDLKEFLGYNRTTKTIDKVIKKDGILDTMGLTRTTKNYPVRCIMNPQEEINGITIREYLTINDLDANDNNYSTIKSFVKNRNYEVKEPLFLTTGYGDYEYGTLYTIQRTHTITLNELLTFMYDESLDNIDFLIYAFMKCKCKGYHDNMKSMALYKIVLELGIDRSTYYEHLRKLKEKGYIDVIHKEWKIGGERAQAEANDYIWKGLE